jgi:DNA-binding CsgD family transcriptional regulator
MPLSGQPEPDRPCGCRGPHLTIREVDVLLRTAAGMSAREIAEKLHISRRTVEYHVGAILRRINAENAVQAVSWCYAVGVLLPRNWPPRWSGQLCISGTDDLPEQGREHSPEPVEQDKDQQQARADADEIA